MSHPSENRSLNAEVSIAQPLVIAHRGASGLAPENTLAALRLAAELGADGIELDVHLAADGHPVVIHDSRVNRTTNGNGAVSIFTVKQLGKLDAALWFESRLTRRPRARSRTLKALGLTDRARRIFADECVPTLDDALSLLSTFGLSRIYIELKGSPGKRALLEAALSVVHRHSLEGIVTLLSFDHDIMRASKELAPGVRTAATFPVPGRRLISTASIIRAARAASVDEVALHAGLASRRATRLLHEQGFAVSAWTANNRLLMRRLVAAGVDAIMTNFPDRLVDVLDSRPNTIKVSFRRALRIPSRRSRRR